MEHLGVHEIAAYLDHRIDDASRRRVEAHLVACAECRREVHEGEQVLRDAPAGRRAGARRPIAALVTLAAAAALVFAVLPRGDTRDASSIERATVVPAAPAAPIVVIEPADSARLSGVPSTFVWRPATGVSSYRITLTDERGHVLWAASTGDTLIRVPDSLAAAAPMRYYWYVDALRADGGTASSGVRGFSVR